MTCGEKILFDGFWGNFHPWVTSDCDFLYTQGVILLAVMEKIASGCFRT
jgi:hypothetical protein